MSNIINMEQIRAARALTDAQEIVSKRGTDGDQLSGYHSLIITNGLLATMAYSIDKKKENELIAEKLMGHLAALQRQKLFPEPALSGRLKDDLLTISSSHKVTPLILAMMTDECMAYLNYLKRFVRALSK